MRILLHTCCAPCLLYPLQKLRQEKHDVTACFYNPNIHPFREFQKRLETLQNYSSSVGLDLIAHDTYELTDFLRKIAFHEDNRCCLCYLMRLEKIALIAKDCGFDAFSTTLLYSKYQNHKSIFEISKTISETLSIPFYYQDFRIGWKTGQETSVKLDLYRQPYCGCVYSEQERYDKRKLK